MRINKVKVTVTALFSILCFSTFSLPLEAKTNIDIGIGTGVFAARPQPRVVYCAPRPRPVPVRMVAGHGGFTPRPAPIQHVFIASGRPSTFDRERDSDFRVGPTRRGRVKPTPPPPVYFERRTVYETIEQVPCEEQTPPCECLPTISDIYDCGDLIQLSDGSLWQIPSCDKSITKNWQRNDQVQIGRTDNNQYPFELMNIKNRSRAKAIMKAGPSQNDDCEYNGSNTQSFLERNVSEGDLLCLKDGSLWEIAAYEQYKTKVWRKGDIITIIRNNNAVYPYQLSNLTSKETAVAFLKTSNS